MAPLSQTCSLQNCEKINFHCLKCLVCVILLWNPSEQIQWYFLLPGGSTFQPFSLKAALLCPTLGFLYLRSGPRGSRTDRDEKALKDCPSLLDLHIYWLEMLPFLRVLVPVGSCCCSCYLFHSIALGLGYERTEKGEKREGLFFILSKLGVFLPIPQIKITGLQSSLCT